MSDEKNDLPGLSVRRPYLMAVVNLLIVIAGISALLGIEVRELPDVDRPVVQVRASLPGAAPEAVDAEVTSVIEGAVARVTGIRDIRSSSEESSSRINIEFSPNINLVDAANDVREAVARIARRLPEEVQDIFVIKADQDARPIIRIAATSDTLSIEDLTRIVEKDVVPSLTSVDGVAEVSQFGAQARVLRVLIDPNRLVSYGLSASDVADLLRSISADIPAGSLKSDSQELIVRANISVTDPEKIRELRLKNGVRLGEVASVFYGPEEATSYVRLNGSPVVSLGIVRQASSNTVEISEGVAQSIERLNAQLRDVTLTVTSDEAVFIKGAIAEVLVSLSLALVIVVGVIWLFSGQLSITIIPALAIPVALIGSVAAIWAIGFSINLITLLALVLATGLVVDDAIVVVENIMRRRAEGLLPRAAAVIGTRQVFFAVVATTATLISVFLPISFMPTQSGRLFREFGFVLAMTVGISTFVALSLCPLIAARIPSSKQAPRRPVLGWIGGTFENMYARILGIVLAAPVVFIAFCAGLGGLALVVFQTIGQELVPSEDRGEITVIMTAPDGVDLGFTDRQVERVEQILQPYLEDGTLTDMFTITGRWDPNRAWIVAPMRDWSQREITQQDLAALLRRPINDIPGAQARISGGNSLGLRGTEGGGITFAVTGDEYGAISAATDALTARLEEEVPALSNFRVEYRATQPQISIDIDRLRASDLGVSIDALSTTLQVLVDKYRVTDLTVGDEAISIYLEPSAGAVRDPADLGNLYVPGNEGRLIPLSQLVSYVEDTVPSELDRFGQRRAIQVNADLDPSMPLQSAVDAIRSVAGTTLPSGTGLVFLGEAASLEDTARDMTIAFSVALLVVFLVLVAQFESVTSAAVVMVTVPFGVCAAIFALMLTGTTLNIYSQIGVLVLIGIMAKNGILMVEFADQLRDKGADVLTAAREAAVIRLKPIVMTMMSTVLAGLPLILASGPGSESRAAIGWVVFGGLALAAVFTLFLTPVAYTIIARLSKPRADAAKRLEEEMAAASGSTGAQQ